MVQYFPNLPWWFITVRENRENKDGSGMGYDQRDFFLTHNILHSICKFLANKKF
jgi:hypothetical protein